LAEQSANGWSGRRYRYQVHTADPDPLKSRNIAVARLADTDMGNTRMYKLGHRAESLDMQPQGNGWKCHAERLHRVDQS
jgi:hypothetical protein